MPKLLFAEPASIASHVYQAYYIVSEDFLASANPKMETQPEALILGNNMSSGVTVPIFGKKFAKMEQCEPFEV